MWLLLCAGCLLGPARAQPDSANYDEARVGAHPLPDPLRMADGKTVASARQWTKVQRPAILRQFTEHVYGKLPGKPPRMRFQVTSLDTAALGGTAIRKQITVFFTDTADAPSMDVLLYLPRRANRPVPVFVGLNFYGNHCVHPDPGIALSTRWMMSNEAGGVVDHRATEAARGTQASRWPVAELIARGYGLATAYYGDLEPDHPEGWQKGIRSQLKDVLDTDETEWGAIGAWAWGLSRIVDYLETDAAVNARQAFVTGHSRLGKAALWAGASDPRFAMVISNESGEGGAALARRRYGETIRRINTAFPHWFAPNYRNYNQDPARLPVDQHLLLALVAPRPLYVASAEGDRWADPKGEFLSAKYAEPVYRLFNRKGVGAADMPAVNQPTGETVRYHIRTGQHDITAYDWAQYLDFADRHFARQPGNRSLKTKAR
ncbi:MAG: acetylxylan esterase [Ferruginibacter sp.]|nr:acetylxylan esterase [Cytophagales bacterium]